ncbi:MAG TPA: patatin-like phospholipase family protein, partial [Tepidisphaeraceae bacterium]|nr:patatin-like phospholipase family protein [Tepidisphaeraceae bacterium]
MTIMSPGMRIGLLCGLCIVGGCTYANKPLNSVNLPLEARAKNRTRSALGADISAVSTAVRPAIVPATTPAQFPKFDDDGYFVGLAISGGGSRSAVFAAACMFQLQKLGLLQRVDYISSVSGGSLAAAYYCLNDRDWNPGATQRKMTHSFAHDVILQIAQPWTMAALAATDLDRSDLLANSFRDHLFSRDGRTLTYKDLLPNRPHLLINSTDLQSGERFVFCNESFNEINSDLSQYPIAYACAASSAVPVVMHQVTLRDFSTIFKQYKHLIDGGINDNLGITTLLEVYDAQVKAAKNAKQPDPYPHGAIFIVLDARTQFDAQISEKGDTGILESLQAGAGLTSTALLNRASSATLAEMIVRYSPDKITAK